MVNELQQVLDDIKLDKDTNLRPENLKAGVTCLGVEGIAEIGGVTNDELDDLLSMCDLYEELYTGKYTDHTYTEEEKNNVMTLINTILGEEEV